MDASGKVNFRRYAPGSWKFQDAQPSAFDQIKAGDRLRVLGDKNQDGSQVKAEEIVTGTFRNLAATIISIDPATNTLKVNNLAVKKGAPVTVKLTPDTSLKRLPPRISMMLARLQNGTTAAGPGGASAEGGPVGRGGPGGAGGPGGGFGGGRGGMGGGPQNLPKMIEQLPQISLADLKSGDALVISAGSR